MSSSNRVVFGGIAAVLAFDLVAALAAGYLAMPYAWASVGSVLLYVGIGYLAARAASTRPMRSALRTAAAAGLADATVGWVIAWQLGVDTVTPAGRLTLARWTATAVMVIGIAVALGALGGAVGGRAPRINAPAA